MNRSRHGVRRKRVNEFQTGKFWAYYPGVYLAATIVCTNGRIMCVEMLIEILSISLLHICVLHITVYLHYLVDIFALSCWFFVLSLLLSIAIIRNSFCYTTYSFVRSYVYFQT